MPFTPAHAAAAWPLRKALPSLPLSAVIIGTLSPDFEYFLRLAPITRWAHTPLGLGFFCVPVSLVVWFVFRRLIRPALVALLPPGLASALGSPSTSWAWTIVAVSLGALTHLVWDGFTHQRDWAVTAWPFLQTEVAPDLVPGLRWYKLLQHVSTAGGLVALVAWIAAWVRSQPLAARQWAPRQLPRVSRALAMIVAMTTVAGVINAVQVTNWPMQVSRFAVGGMIGGSIALLVLGISRDLSRRAPRS